MGVAFYVSRLPSIAAKLREKVRSRLTPAAIARAVEPVLSQEMMSRFDRFSAGGGDWKKLAPVTIARKRSDAILIETGDLRRALKLGLKVTATWVGSQVRCEARMKSKRKHKPSKMTVDRLLDIHQFGTERIPARKVIVRPSRAVILKAQQAVLRMIRSRR